MLKITSKKTGKSAVITPEKWRELEAEGRTGLFTAEPVTTQKAPKVKAEKEAEKGVTETPDAGDLMEPGEGIN